MGDGAVFALLDKSYDFSLKYKESFGQGRD